MSKAANDNGSRRIMYLKEGTESGLKILVSAVQSRPCPPLFSASCPSPIFLRREFVTRFVTNSGTLQRIPAHVSGSGRRELFLPDPTGTRFTDPLLCSSSGAGLTCPACADRIGTR